MRDWISNQGSLRVLIRLRSDHRAITPACRAPTIVKVARTARERKLLGQFLVNLNAMTRNFAGIEKSLLRLWTPFEDLSGFLRETSALMNAKVIAREFQRELSRVGNW